ncbi:hypothetical protein NPIL_80341 [Nephila pilipes]|uniref:Uncharacterized protein n=1 Tax=Nephila pilipes TaxID=299642 RepID=A0A8X6PM67_NEPPI|nr:hypothetical protein NPIL_80341 [Nephila pilipes]
MRNKNRKAEVLSYGLEEQGIVKLCLYVVSQSSHGEATAEARPGGRRRYETKKEKIDFWLKRGDATEKHRSGAALGSKYMKLASIGAVTSDSLVGKRKGRLE